MANTNNNKSLNVPILRFPEFTDEWKRSSLGEVTTFVKERIGADKLTRNNYVSTENMNPDFGGINQASSVPNNTNVIHYQKGDVLLSNIRPYLRKVWAASSDGGCSADVFVFRAKSISSSFLHYIMANDTFINYVMSGAKGVKMPRGDKEQILKYIFSTPNIEEQNKISHLLHLLDERISTQNKIIGDLKKLKSAIYQEIFSNLQGEECSLSDLAEIIKGQQINGSELSDSGKYYVMNGGIAPSGYYDSYNTEADTISISEGGNSCGYVQYNSSEFWSGGHCYTLRIKPTSSMTTQFLFHYLKWKEPDIMALRIGSGLPNIQKKDLSKISIIVPTLDKQLQLTVLFSAFKKKIENEEMYVANLDKQKQYLLQQMFI